VRRCEKIASSNSIRESALVIGLPRVDWPRVELRLFLSPIRRHLNSQIELNVQKSGENVQYGKHCKNGHFLPKT
jgi:hypothetical protein